MATRATLNFKEGDYVLIGDDIKVYFDFKTGRNTLMLAVDAPDDVPVLRSKPYLRQVSAQAAEGDTEAQALEVKLKKQHDRARRSAYASRARRNEQELRGAQG